MENKVLEKLESGARFSEVLWSKLANAVADAFRFTDDERKRFLANNLPKLIAAIPFLAGCEDPERTAISHLGTYILSIKAKSYAIACPSDNEYFMKRLEMLSNFIDGDDRIIQKGMNLIGLCMLENYAQDVEADGAAGKYNPLREGVWDFDEIRVELVREIEDVECTEMDEIMDPKASIPRFWLV